MTKIDLLVEILWTVCVYVIVGEDWIKKVYYTLLHGFICIYSFICFLQRIILLNSNKLFIGKIFVCNAVYNQ